MSEGEYFHREMVDFVINFEGPDVTTLNRSNSLTLQGDFALWLGEIDSDAPNRPLKHIIDSGFAKAEINPDTQLVRFTTAQLYLQEKNSYWSSIFEIDSNGRLTIGYAETLGDTTKIHYPTDSTFNFVSGSNMDLANYFYAAELSPINATDNQNNIMFFAMPVLDVY